MAQYLSLTIAKWQVVEDKGHSAMRRNTAFWRGAGVGAKQMGNRLYWNVV